MPNLGPQVSSAESPWKRLNLRWNPFGEPRPTEAGKLVVIDRPFALVGPLLRERSVVQLVGECGRGKTARLRLLEERFPGVPYVYLAEDEPLPELPAPRARGGGGPALLLDEAQRLPRPRRRELFRLAAASGAALAIASHRDLEAEIEGEDLEAHTFRLRGLDLDHLQRIVARRLDWARAAPGPVPELDRSIAARLLESFGDDLRSLLDELYEIYQSRATGGEDEIRWRSVS